MPINETTAAELKARLCAMVDEVLADIERRESASSPPAAAPASSPPAAGPTPAEFYDAPSRDRFKTDFGDCATCEFFDLKHDGTKFCNHYGAAVPPDYLPAGCPAWVDFIPF